MAELHFLRPLWFFAFIPLIVMLFVFFYKTQANKSKQEQQSVWKNEVDAHLLEHVLIAFPATQRKTTKSQAWKVVASFWTISVLALAGPSWDKTTPMQISPDIAPLVIVMDLSHSMLVRDIYPNRLKRAQYKLRILIEKMINRPISLLVYSVQAHSVMPLTQDARLVSHLLEYMTPDIMPAPGSNHSAGLQLAANVLRKNNSKKAQILLVTDGLDDNAVNTIEQITSEDLQVLIYLIATEDGGAIPQAEDGTRLNDNGKDFSALEQAVLTQLTQKKLGYYAVVTNDNQDIVNLLSRSTDFIPSYIESSYLTKDAAEQQTIQVWRDRGGWLILLILPFALLMFRSSIMSVLLAGYLYSFMFFYSVPAEANDWQTIWYNNNTQGKMALANNDPESAEQLFSEMFWRGVAQYRQQKYHQALESFSNLNSAAAYYNKANTLVHLKHYKEAIIAYKTALRINDSLSEAKHNLQLVEDYQQQSQEKELSDINSLNLSKNTKAGNALKPAEQPEKLSDKSSARIEKYQQEKQSAENRAENSLVQGDSRKSAKSGLKEKNNMQIPDKSEYSESSGEPAKQNSKKTQGYNNSTQTKNRSLHDKLTKKKATQNTDAASQVNAKITTKNSEIAKQLKNKPDNNKLKKSADPLQEKSNDELKNTAEESVIKTSQAASMQATENTIAKPEAKEYQDNTSDQPAASTGSTKQTISKQEEKHEPSILKIEQFQSMEYWLDSIKDDPTELLKEKFKREYKRTSRFSAMDQK